MGKPKHQRSGKTIQKADRTAFVGNLRWILRAVPVGPVKPRVTVLTFDRDGKQGSYSFRGEPDWARIERETLGEEMLAVIVKMPKRIVRIAARCLGMPGWHKDYCGVVPNHTFSGTAMFGTTMEEEITRILNAIEKWRGDTEDKPTPVPAPQWKPEAGKRAWWDGHGISFDPYPARNVTLTRLNGWSNWLFTDDNGREFGGAASHRFSAPHEENPLQWKPGDWAYHQFRGIVKITEIRGRQCRFDVLMDGSWAARDIRFLRPLTDADWTRDIGGVKVRAYQDIDGDIAIKTPNDTVTFVSNYSKEIEKVLREFCRLAGLPIMPYELSKGNYKRP